MTVTGLPGVMVPLWGDALQPLPFVIAAPPHVGVCVYVSDAEPALATVNATVSAESGATEIAWPRGETTGPGLLTAETS